MEYIITFVALCAAAATFGAIAVFAIEDQKKLEKIARNGFLGIVNAGLLLLVLGLLS
jgi:hypothetical protein